MLFYSCFALKLVNNYVKHRIRRGLPYNKKISTKMQQSNIFEISAGHSCSNKEEKKNYSPIYPEHFPGHSSQTKLRARFSTPIPSRARNIPRANTHRTRPNNASRPSTLGGQRQEKKGITQ